MMMKSRKFFALTVPALLGALILSACAQGPSSPQPDSRLKGGPWKNGDAATLSGLYKEFTINDDYTFTAYINPTFMEVVKQANGGTVPTDPTTIATVIPTARGMVDTFLGGGKSDAEINAAIENWTWTVTGKLIIDEGEIYIMDALEETDDKDLNALDPSLGKANAMIGNFNMQKVKLEFTGENTFTFESAENTTAVTDYFGGAYSKQ
ncbi:MAG: hypothetical protein LBQ46_03280 [Treponema sp.]|jgi:hypothetical protein|nr:hypothetical protein [Treponema sp.]